LQQTCCLNATTLHPRVVPIGSHSISNIGNMMGCDHQSCVPVGTFAGELWHFEYFPTTTVRQLLIFHHMTVTVVRIFCCIPNFIKDWFTSSASRRPSLLNVQSAVARPVGLNSDKTSKVFFVLIECNVH